MPDDPEAPTTEEKPPSSGKASSRKRRNGWEAAAPAGGEGQVVAVLVEGAEEIIAPPESPYDKPGSWYVVHTYAGYENKVKSNLESRISSMNMEDRIYEVVIPLEDVVELKNGKRQVVSRKVFPGYLMVRMALDDDSWYVVRNTPGCYRLRRPGCPTDALVAPRGREHPGSEGGRRRSGQEDPSSSRVRSRRVRPGERGAVRRFQRHDCRDQRGPAQAQGTRQHLRPRDTSRIRVRPGGKALTSRGRQKPTGDS
jgi:hypothetical protein